MRETEMTTSGERLCFVVRTRLVEPSNWAALSNSIALAARVDEYLELFQEILAVNLSCRIVTLGRSLEKSMSTDDPVFLNEYSTALRDVVGIPYSAHAVVFRNAVEAVRASLHDFTLKERDRLRKTARKSCSRCYMCGTQLDFEGGGRPHEAYTLDHVWPRRFGGDSIDENALPCCSSCNGTKGDFATWGMVGVQALMLGVAPSGKRLDEIDKSFKFALHHRSATAKARDWRCSLAEAYRRLGPWRSPEVIEATDVADFFNLRNWEELS